MQLKLKDLQPVPDDVVAWLIERAEELVTIEKKHRTGKKPDKNKAVTENPYTSFIVKDDKFLVVPSGFVQCDPDVLKQLDVDEKDLHSLVVRTISILWNADAHVVVSEAFSLNCCGHCGSKEIEETSDKKFRCKQCGQNPHSIAPSQSQFSDEALITFAEVRGKDKAYSWIDTIVRSKEDGSIVDFKNVQSRDEFEVHGRFVDAWSLEGWMGPHFIMNSIAISKMLNVPVEDKLSEMVDFIKQSKPDDYPIIDLSKMMIADYRDISDRVEKGEEALDAIRNAARPSLWTVLDRIKFSSN